MDEFVLKSIGEPTMPRLFHGSNASGSFKMEEVLNFTQVDLVTDDVMLLDTGDTMFAWLGIDANKGEKLVYQLGILSLSCSQYSQTIC